MMNTIQGVCFTGLRMIAIVMVSARIVAALGQPALSISQQNLLTQITTAFSRGHEVSRIKLAGSAKWFAGSVEDSGTVTLAAASDGTSQMELSLSDSGQRTEAQTGAGIDAACNWSGNDGVSHDVSTNNCWRPFLWFLPAFSLQRSTLQESTTIADLGLESNSSSAIAYRHLQGTIALNGLPKTMGARITTLSTSDLELDPASLMPTVLSYKVLPEGAPATPIAMQIRYSNYRQNNGVRIPFTIERYVNGVLQLQLSITSIEVN
jgi:hypothetical protein